MSEQLELPFCFTAEEYQEFLNQWHKAMQTRPRIEELRPKSFDVKALEPTPEEEAQGIIRMEVTVEWGP